MGYQDFTDDDLRRAAVLGARVQWWSLVIAVIALLVASGSVYANVAQAKNLWPFKTDPIATDAGLVSVYEHRTILNNPAGPTTYTLTVLNDSPVALRDVDLFFPTPATKQSAAIPKQVAVGLDDIPPCEKEAYTVQVDGNPSLAFDKSDGWTAEFLVDGVPWSERFGGAGPVRLHKETTPNRPLNVGQVTSSYKGWSQESDQMTPDTPTACG